MDEHLLILPHTLLFAPAIAQPGELLNSIPIDELFFEKLAYKSVEVGTIVVEIHSVPICRSIMEGREEVCQCGKFFVEFFMLSIHNSICDDVAQRLATAIFFNKQTIQPAIIAKWSYDIMRIAGQAIAAHQVQVMKFLFHTLIFFRDIGAATTIACKELADHLCMAMFFFVQIHFIASAHAKDAEPGFMIIESQLWQYIILQVVVEWIVCRQMTDIIL